MAKIVDGPYIPESEHHCPDCGSFHQGRCSTHQTQEQRDNSYENSPERRNQKRESIDKRKIERDRKKDK